MPLVADASFAGAWVLPDEASALADRVLGRILKGQEELAVPDLWSYEMTNLLVTAHRRRRLTAEQVSMALKLIATVPCQYYDHSSALARERISKLALRFRLSAYDAAYLELGDRLQCPLHTNDTSLKQAATSMGLE